MVACRRGQPGLALAVASAGCAGAQVGFSGLSEVAGRAWAVAPRPGSAAPRQAFPAAAPLGAGAAPVPPVGAASAAAAALSSAVVAAGVAAAVSSRRRGGARLPKASVARQQSQRSGDRSVACESLCDASEPADSIRRRFEAVVARAQDRICAAIETVDGGAKFQREGYTRGDKPGGGVAAVLTNGNIFEKAGCNLSVVYGDMPQEALAAATEQGVDRVGVKLEPGQKVPFFACGLSSVMHPRNPHCPTMHFNYRYFETAFGTWWFGGGTDITPSYLDEADMRHFHGTYKRVCDRFNPTWYPRFKAWADKYFLIAHRGERRGLGGIFFDDLNEVDKETHLRFADECLQAVPEAYVPLLEKHRNDAFTPEQKAWQQLRRGRYVEFNLVYDRGTIFGLKMLPTGVGRLESILMSLPETARWEYNHAPAPGTPEADIMDAFKNPREWV